MEPRVHSVYGDIPIVYLNHVTVFLLQSFFIKNTSLEMYLPISKHVHPPLFQTYFYATLLFKLFYNALNNGPRYSKYFCQFIF